VRDGVDDADQLAPRDASGHRVVQAGDSDLP
jgi:hypothetical protein